VELGLSTPGSVRPVSLYAPHRFARRTADSLDG
jgi:hypothetical protein